MRRSCEQAAPEPAAREQGWRAWANGSALSDGPTKDAIATGVSASNADAHGKSDSLAGHRKLAVRALAAKRSVDTRGLRNRYAA
jgi:hypothetical protein